MRSLISVCLIILLASCAGAPVDSTQNDNYFNTHAKLMQSLPDTAVTSEPLEKFQNVLGDFNDGMTEENLRSLYADDLYFNDTFVTITTIDELVEYLLKTAGNATTTVKMLDVSKSETDYYLRWSMDIEFVARGKAIRSRSIGMTQVRFNEQGKVIFHQDYWDSANAFYQHLPVVGGLVQRVRNSLH
ncbi:MAG: nuclear transport factor 2 family protein [Gammaproteobacteria bacterium]|nr:nuclear transport factor 2 family protein [Gammaproteobacteria bacterium]NNM14449.1 nuclear transport factor 2 family protein [Gammaproteobacteria bacterium]